MSQPTSCQISRPPHVEIANATLSFSPARNGLLQRKCACGVSASSDGECEECESKKRLQTELTINDPGDIYEQEADRIADQMMATTASHTISDTPVSVRRVAGQASGQMAAAHASVNHVLASPGRPLEPALRQEMGQRFGHDFARVRVHANAAAEQSARDVNAHAYTVGQNIVFGAGQFAPSTQDGRRLIAHELAHVVQQSGADGMNVGQSNDKPGLPPITAALQRAPTGHGLGGTAPAKPSSTSIDADAVWTDLHAFVDRGNEALRIVNTRIREYLSRYDEAHKEVVNRLSEAQKEEAERKKWEMALETIVAVGIGLASEGIWEEANLLLLAVKELLKKGAEVGTVAALSPPESKVDFGLPAEVQNDRIARDYLDLLAQAWMGMSLTGQAVLAFDTLVHDSERAAAPAGSADPRAKLSTSVRPPAAAPLTSEGLRDLRKAMTAEQNALALFLGTVDTPVLERGQRAIERDLWIRWMSQSNENAGASHTDKKIEARLREIGVYEELGDFSYASDDYSELVRASKLQTERLNQLGRVGVVVLPPFWSLNQSHPLPGVVHIRADAYQAAGRQKPRQAGAPSYVAIEWQGESNLLTGDVVILADTSPDRSGVSYGHEDTYRAGGLLPKRLGPLLGVDATERAAALAFLRLDAAAYPSAGSAVVGERPDLDKLPDRARPFASAVLAAVESLHAQPPIVVSESEDGVLVREADGTGLVLFTVYTSWGEAKKTQLRTGVRRVVAIELHPSNTFEDFADKDIVVTRQANFSAEISAVRSLLGYGRIIGPPDNRAPK